MGEQLEDNVKGKGKALKGKTPAQKGLKGAEKGKGKAGKGQITQKGTEKNGKGEAAKGKNAQNGTENGKGTVVGGQPPEIVQKGKGTENRKGKAGKEQIAEKGKGNTEKTDIGRDLPAKGAPGKGKKGTGKAEKGSTVSGKGKAGKEATPEKGSEKGLPVSGKGKDGKGKTTETGKQEDKRGKNGKAGKAGKGKDSTAGSDEAGTEETRDETATPGGQKGPSKGTAAGKGKSSKGKHDPVSPGFCGGGTGETASAAGEQDVAPAGTGGTLTRKPSVETPCKNALNADALNAVSPGSDEKLTPPDKRSAPALRRPPSAVSVNGIVESDTNGRVKRVKCLTDEQKDAISQLTHPSQLSHAERKRQFGALHRRLEKEDTLPAGVLAKWEAATTQKQKFEFLKCFMLDESLSNVTVEAWHREASTSKNKAKFLELPLDELEKSYDPEWLKSKVVSCQKGRPHPQDPTNERKRIYRVFHSIEDVKASVEETGHCLKGKARVSGNKAIRDGLGAVITKKQALHAHDPLQMQLAIEDGSPEGEQPVKRRRTKLPKEKTPEEKRSEELRKQLDQTIKSIQALSGKARTAAIKLVSKGIQHQEVMISNLKKSREWADEVYAKLNDEIFKGSATQRTLEVAKPFEPALEEMEERVKSAEIIIQAHDRREAAAKKALEAKAKPKAKKKAGHKQKVKTEPEDSVFGKLAEDETECEAPENEQESAPTDG